MLWPHGLLFLMRWIGWVGLDKCIRSKWLSMKFTNSFPIQLHQLRTIFGYKNHWIGSFHWNLNVLVGWPCMTKSSLGRSYLADTFWSRYMFSLYATFRGCGTYFSKVPNCYWSMEFCLYIAYKLEESGFNIHWSHDSNTSLRLNMSFVPYPFISFGSFGFVGIVKYLSTKG